MPTLSGFAPVPIRGPAALPIIGVHVNALRLLSDPIGHLMRMHREFGDIVTIADRSPAFVCAFGAERNHEVLSHPSVFDNDDEFLLPTPPGSALDKLKKGLLFQTAEGHRRHRRLLMPAFHRPAVEGYAGDIVAVTEAVLRTWPVGATADIAALTRDLVQHVAVRTLFGLDWSEEDHTIGQLASDAVDLLTSPLAPLFPFDVPGTPYHHLLKICEALCASLQALIDEKRRQPPGRDALALMLHAHDEDHAALSDDELIGELVTLFVAGQDTQARSLAWTLFLLSQHPDVLASVVDEVEAVLRGGPPTLEHLPRLPLLDRVIKESMRVLAPAPVLFIRVCQTEAKLGPYTLPPKASVLLSPFITHRDPARFPEPARFRPERWETLQPTPYEYLPFGTGPRMCIGAGFATLAMRLILPMILQRFRLTLAHHATISRLVRGNILVPRFGLPMLIATQDRRFAKRQIVRGDIPAILDLS